MSIGAFVLFASIVFFASVVQGISGFAFGLIVLMVFPHLFGYSDALVLANLMTLVLLVYNSFLYRRYCAWKWLPVGVSVFAVTDLLGVLVLKRVGDSPIWYTLLGVMFILMAVYMMWGQNKLHIRVNQVTLAIFSGVTGLLIGAFAVGGPIMAVFFMEACRSKEEYLGTIQVLSLFGMALDMAFRIANGMVTWALVGDTMKVLIFLLAGVLVATRLVRRIDALMLRRIVCLLMLVNGVVMIASS